MFFCLPRSIGLYLVTRDIISHTHTQRKKKTTTICMGSWHYQPSREEGSRILFQQKGCSFLSYEYICLFHTPIFWLSQSHISKKCLVCLVLIEKLFHIVRNIYIRKKEKKSIQCPYVGIFTNANGSFTSAVSSRFLFVGTPKGGTVFPFLKTVFVFVSRIEICVLCGKDL
jgi:hypothetical protein